MAASARSPVAGSLDSTSAFEILRLLETKGASARVRFDTERGSGEVDVIDGVIVDAFVGDLFGVAALTHLIGIGKGHFEVSYESMPPRPALIPTIAELVNDRAQRSAQWRSLCAVAPPLSAFLLQSPQGQSAASEGRLSTTDRGLFTLADGQRSIVEIIDASGLDAVRALSALVEAVKNGWLTVRESPPDAETDGAPQVEVQRPERVTLEKPNSPAPGPTLSGVSLRRKTTVGLGIPEPVRPRRTGPNSVKPSSSKANPGKPITAQRIVSIGSSEPPPPTAEKKPSSRPPAADAAPQVEVKTAPDDAPPAAAGADRRFIDRYELLCRIGYGGMGYVYLSRISSQRGFRRLFALKVLRTHLVDNGSAANRFLEEARLAAHIHHPNVVPVFDAGVHGDQPYLVMDYVEGASLRELLSASPENRPAELVIPIVVDALAGLYAAHTSVADDGTPFELVHCDVSPENLLVGVDGVCRLTDFGVARHGPAGNERDRSTHGKPAYLAPEQITGGIVDRRADIFAMGVVLYNALTGVKLFESPDVQETLRRVCQEPIEPPSMVGLHPRPVFDFVCMRALEREPTRRFNSAEEMANELRRVALREGLFAPPSQVAAWVRSVASPELARRRLAVLDALRQPVADRPAQDPPAGKRRISDPPQSVPGNEASRTVALPELEMEPVASVFDATPRSSPARTAAIVVASVIALAVVAASLLWTRQIARILHLKTEASTADGPPEVPVAPEPSASSPVPSATPPAASPTAP